MRQIKRWQEPFYGIGGFGTGFMLMVAMSYLAPFYLPPMEEITGGAINLAPVILFTVLFTISRVIDGLSDFLAILSISSIYTIPLQAASTS